MNIFKQSAEPHKKKLRQIRIADIVIVRRIGRHHDGLAQRKLFHRIMYKRIKYKCFAADRRRQLFNAFINPVEHVIETARGIGKRIGFREIPNHWDRLSTKSISDPIARCIPAADN